MKSLYLTNRFFVLFGVVAFLFVLSFPFDFLFPVVQAFFVFIVALAIVDYFLIFNKNIKLRGERFLPKVFSLSDENEVKLEIENFSGRNLILTIIDELPFQFQKRDFEKEIELEKSEEKTINYSLRPVTRGVYNFGKINVFAETDIGLIQKRFQLGEEQEIPVYPSIIQMKEYELMAFDKFSMQKGLKKLRRLGHSYEFEQIKSYVKGDDYRSINWKATGRKNVLMVNQYQDERSQQIYCIIDKSRVMKMPFNDLSLLDYSINTALAISNIILRKYDKAGLITFSDKLGSTIKAENSPNQLNKILQALYNEKERHLESNYELLYHISRKLIKGRSLLLLFTNFESMYALDRVLPVFRKMNILHLLVVVFFENTEINDFLNENIESLQGVYTQTVARQFVTEKRKMAYKLRQYGIQTIITRPEELSINTINKYIELKSRGLI